MERAALPTARSRVCDGATPPPRRRPPRRELDPKIVRQIGQQFVGPCWGTVEGYDDHGNDDCGSMRNFAERIRAQGCGPP